MTISETDLEYWKHHFSFLNHDLTDGRWVDVVNRLREECPVMHSDAHAADDDERGFYILNKYEDIIKAHNEPEVYSSCPVTMPTANLARPWIPIESDPPLHRNYKSILAGLFSKRTQYAKEKDYRAIAHDLLVDLAGKGEADLFKDFCMPFPSRVIMDAFDIPQADRDHVQTLMMMFVHRPGAMEDPEETAKHVIAAAIELNGYLTGLIDERRGTLGEDMISILAATPIDGGLLTTKEIVDYSMLVIPAGFETTSFTMSYIFSWIDARPDLRAALMADHDLIPKAIEEIMRLETPTRALARTVMVDHEVQGTVLRRGDRVVLNWASADRDPAEFPDPDEFIADRHPNRHFGFGWGPHLCSGIHMARIEMRVAVEEVLRIMPDYRITDRTALNETPGMTWCLGALPITWDGAAARARVESP